MEVALQDLIDLSTACFSVKAWKGSKCPLGMQGVHEGMGGSKYAAHILDNFDVLPDMS